MKYYLLFLTFLATASYVFTQSKPQEYPDVNKHAIRDRQKPYTPYEVYTMDLQSANKLLAIYQKKYDIQRQNTEEKKIENLYQSKLRAVIRSLVDDREKFIAYAKRDKSLTVKQHKIVNKIQNASFPVLNEKNIDDLTSVELIQSIENESSTIAPLIKMFLDQIGNKNWPQ